MIGDPCIPIFAAAMTPCGTSSSTSGLPFCTTRNSSADPYTSYVFGLWNYARCPIATAAEKATATRLLAKVAQRVEQFGGDIPRLDLSYWLGVGAGSFPGN